MKTDIPQFRYVWQWFVGVLAIVAECGLLQFYKNGLTLLSSEHSIRTYLDEYG